MAINFPGTRSGTTGAAAANALPMTIAAWFRCTNTTASQYIAMVTSGTRIYALNAGGNVAGDPVRAVTIDPGTQIAVTTTGYTSGQWHHGCAVFAADNDRRAYIDGGSEGTNTSSVTFSGLMSNTSIGATTAGGNVFNGDIAEVGIWDVALTINEIAALARGVSPRRVRPSNLRAYFPLHHGGSNQSFDWSGGGAVVTWNTTMNGANHPPVGLFTRKIATLPEGIAEPGPTFSPGWAQGINRLVA